MCGEYHCRTHRAEPLEGGAADDDCILVDSGDGRQACAACGNGPERLVECSEAEFDVALAKKAADLAPAIKQSALRRGFGLVLLARFHEQVTVLDTLEASPLEQRLWIGFIASGLVRYFDPQVKVYDNKGEYVVRVDFASTLIKMAVFTDGHTYHSSTEARARDADHNRRLEAEGWLVKRYWTEAITERFDETLDEIYSLTAQRIWDMHTAMSVWTP
jgi:very-short-patch-repair endonuclease